MTAEIKTFHRDLAKALEKLVTFDGTITVQELHERHNQIRLLRQEAYAQHAAGLFTDEDFPRKVWPITNAMIDIHCIALQNGVPKEKVEEFNKERWDVKDAAECRARDAKERAERVKARGYRR